MDSLLSLDFHSSSPYYQADVGLYFFFLRTLLGMVTPLLPLHVYARWQSFFDWIVIRSHFVILLLSYMVTWLLGYMVTWLYGYLVLWSFGFLVIWLYGYLVIWLFGWMVIWLHGDMMIQIDYVLHIYFVNWLLGYLGGIHLSTNSCWNAIVFLWCCFWSSEHIFYNFHSITSVQIS